MNQTQEKIIELSRDMIQQIGYQSFTYKHVSAQLNIKNAAIHHYFPTKEDLAIAVIEKDKSDFEDMMRCLEGESPVRKVESILESYTAYFTQGRRLCLMSTFGAIYNNIPDSIQVKIQDYSVMARTWLASVFKEGLETGDFHFDSTLEDMVLNWFISLPGSLQMGRIAGEQYFYEVIDLLRRSLKMK